MSPFSLDYLNRLKNVIENVDHGSMDKGIQMIREAWEQNQQIITMGNGGSAHTALHYITDWNKIIPLRTKKPFRGRSLLDNIGLITAYANDLNYQAVFYQQLGNICQNGDLVIALSGSGNSQNVLEAIAHAKTVGCKTLGLCGYDGGKLKNAVDHAIHINVNDMQLAEDLHMVFGHIVLQALTQGT